MNILRQGIQFAVRGSVQFTEYIHIYLISSLIIFFYSTLIKVPKLCILTYRR